MDTISGPSPRSITCECISPSFFLRPGELRGDFPTMTVLLTCQSKSSTNEFLYPLEVVFRSFIKPLQRCCCSNVNNLACRTFLCSGDLPPSVTLGNGNYLAHCTSLFRITTDAPERQLLGYFNDNASLADPFYDVTDPGAFEEAEGAQARMVQSAMDAYTEFLKLPGLQMPREERDKVEPQPP